MQDFINLIREWIVANWQLVITIGIGFIQFILLLITKKVKFTDNSITARIVPLVIEAEKKFGSGHGEEKLQYVLAELNNHQFDNIYKFIIEQILSTPQKKD